MITFSCSKCDKVLEEIGIPPQIQMLQMYKQVVNIGTTEVPEKIKNDPYLYRGFFCPNCIKAFCPQCSHMQGEICPECGQRGLMPAYRPLLKKIPQKEAGRGVASTTRVVVDHRVSLRTRAWVGLTVCASISAFYTFGLIKLLFARQVGQTISKNPAPFIVFVVILIFSWLGSIGCILIITNRMNNALAKVIRSILEGRIVNLMIESLFYPEKQSSGKRGDLQKKVEIKQVLEKSRERHQLPKLEEILDILVAVEQLTNYATLVEIALETAAEYRGVYIGDLKSAYMKFWWWWHNHRDEPKYRAEKVIVIAGEAAQVYPDSEIGWTLISHLLVWIDEGGPDRSGILKDHFGEIPTLDQIGKYQGTAR